MSEVNPAPAAAVKAEVPPAVQPAVAPAATSNNAEVVTQLQKDVADLKAALNAANAAKRVEQKKPEVTAKPIEQPTLERQAEELRKLQATVFGQAKNAAIISAAAAKTGDMTEHFKKYVSAVYGENIEVTENAQVVYREGETLTPIATWIDAFLQTDEGGKFVPGKPAAKTDGLKGTQTATVKSSDEIFGNLKHGELMRDPKRFTAAMKADPARVEALRIEADRERQKTRK